MNHHGYGNDDSSFDEFRKRKHRQQRQRRLAEGQAGFFANGIANNAARVIEEGEQREAQDMQLKREMDEFVRDTTKLAAGVLCEVNEQKDRRGGSEDHAQQMARMKALETEAARRGAASLTPETPPRAVMSLEEHLQQESERVNGGASQEVLRVAALEPTPVPPHLQQGARSSRGADADFADFRGDALSDFCDADDHFEELPDDPDVLNDSVREFERISHLEPSCSDEDLPLAVASEAPAPKVARPPLPLGFTRLVSDPDRCKATLKCLVNGGILDRLEARGIYAEMKERWSQVLD